MRKRQILLLILLLSIIITYFLPWFAIYVVFNGEEYKQVMYGYGYVVPIVFPYNIPVGVISVIGFILSILSFNRAQRFHLLNIMAGILILLGGICAFFYTFNVAASVIPSSSVSWSVNIWAEYGLGLMLLFGLLIGLIGVFEKLYGALRGLYLEMKPLVKIGVCGTGVVCLIIGFVLTALGVYGLAGGAGITFTINERVVTAQEGGQIFSIIGIIILLVGIGFTYLGFKRMK